MKCVLLETSLYNESEDMIRRVITSLVAVLVTLAWLPCNAAEENLRFSHINTQNSDLSYDGIRCMMRDSRGYVWIGTQKGLSRYDGARFKVYDRNALGVDSDYVNSLREDIRGNILIGTDRGLVIYDPLTDKMTPLEGLSCRVYTMCSAPAGKIFLGVKSEGLYVYDAMSGEISRIELISQDGNLLKDIYRMVVCKDGTIYLASYCDNLYKTSLDELDSGVVSVLNSIFAKDDIEGLAVNPRNPGSLYVLSQGHGLVELDTMNSDFRIMIPLPENVFPTQLSYHEDHLWVTSSLGLYVFDLVRGSYVRYLNDNNDIYSLSDSYTTCMMSSDNGKSIWVGTSGGGINVYSSTFGHFRKFYRLADGTALEGCNVRCFAEDSEGRLWLGTENEGLLFAGEDGIHRCDRTRGLGAIKALLADGQKLWIGTNNGLWFLDLADEGLVHPARTREENPLYNRRILDMMKGRNGLLYVGTAVGAYTYDPKSGEISKIEGTGIDAIEDIVEDYDGTVWMATYSNGIYSYNPNRQPVLSHYCSKYDDTPVPEMVSSLSLDNDGNLWVIGFSSGLLMRDVSTGSFKSYSRVNVPSLPSDLFYSCLHDDKGNLWLASDAGLVLFNPQLNTVKVYEEYSGILESSMRLGHLRLSSGEFAFGFNSGAMLFDPHAVLQNESVQIPVVTDFYIHGRRVEIDDKILKEPIDHSVEIELSSQQRSFAFDFAVPLSELCVKYNLFCCLEGYDEDWHDVTVPKSISYHNVPPGDYRLQIKTASVTSGEEMVHYPIYIKVRPPFFQSVAGIITIVLAICLLGLAIFYIIRKREKKRAERKREEYEKRREEQLLSEKMDFLSNIANEIKTPLTLMKTPLMNLESMEALAGNSDLQTIISEADTLDGMTGDLLDYIRAEENGYILQKRNIDIVEKVGFICVNFKEVFRDKSVKLKFLHTDKQIMMSVDSKAFGKILTSVLNYVSGYAVNTVEVSLKKIGAELDVTVRYDTYPVGERHAEYMFKPFSQYSSTRSIGIGLSYARTLAQIHGGDLKFALEPSRRKASFTFCLPIEQSKEPETLKHDDIIINSALPLILIVEGNSKLLAYMKRHLKKFFNVLACSSAEEALQYIITWNVDLIVADLGLSGMNGMELCSKIRANDATSHIPFVVIASSMSADIKLSCMKKGANQCIEMPFSMDYMKACLDNILENKSRVKTHVVHSRRNLVDRSVNIVDRDEAFLEKFETLIMENISNPDFSVKDMEQKLGFSRSSFNRKTNALLGMSPNEYLRQRRLTLAAQMLERRNGSVSDICYKVGFNSPSYFAKCFREHFGVLPADYPQAEK